MQIGIVLYSLGTQGPACQETKPGLHRGLVASGLGAGGGAQVVYRLVLGQEVEPVTHSTNQRKLPVPKVIAGFLPSTCSFSSLASGGLHLHLTRFP